MPKGVPMLVKAVTKQIKEDDIDSILDGIKGFVSAVFIEIENIQADTVDEVEEIQTVKELVA